VVAQMVHQRRLVLDLPITVFPFDKTEMLGGALDYGLAALLDVMADLGGVDLGDRRLEIDRRAPGGERRQQRQLCQVPPIALGRQAGQTPAFLPPPFCPSPRPRPAPPWPPP